MARRDVATSSSKASPNVQVYFHIVQAGQSASQGHVSKASITQQMKVLNNAFEGTGLSFRLAGTEYITNKDWFENVALNTQREMTMKKKHNRGHNNIVDVYTVGLLHPTEHTEHKTVGWSTYPFDHDNAYGDGIVILHSTLPGGAGGYYNEGKILVHEVGHWFGLLHVFNEDGKCNSYGDGVSDTPVQATPSFECKVKNSCPNSPGTDSIHNYMDYTQDICRYEFTPGQKERMRAQAVLYRGIHIPDFDLNSPHFKRLRLNEFERSVAIGGGIGALLSALKGLHFLYDRG